MVHRSSCGECGVVCLLIELAALESFSREAVMPQEDGGFGRNSGAQFRTSFSARFLPSARCIVCHKIFHDRRVQGYVSAVQRSALAPDGFRYSAAVTTRLSGCTKTRESCSGIFSSRSSCPTCRPRNLSAMFADTCRNRKFTSLLNHNPLLLLRSSTILLCRSDFGWHTAFVGSPKFATRKLEFHNTV
jgi:hypothetical protein